MHHTVFMTNRCNSHCLMCSQPPTPHDDSWLIEEAKQIAMHIRRPPPVLGFTGGEPLLLGQTLREVIETFASELPDTRFEVLTNGRGFSNRELAATLLTALPARVSWMVPLYGHADFLHDHVVQSEGAFDETIDGLLTLHAFRQPIQLRIVLIEPVLRALPELCTFIARNLPFVREVALMGCEPVGYALANRTVCEVNLADWRNTLAQAVRCLTRADVPPVLMNVPLCALEANLRQFAHRSISDWKQVYAPECESCQMRKDCCGLFASTVRGWRPAVIQPIREIA
jgi:His-Xaa-Ser system radical SAM maturase HxsC